MSGSGLGPTNSTLSQFNSTALVLFRSGAEFTQMTLIISSMHSAFSLRNCSRSYRSCTLSTRRPKSLHCQLDHFGRLPCHCRIVAIYVRLRLWWPSSDTRLPSLSLLMALAILLVDVGNRPHFAKSSRDHQPSQTQNFLLRVPTSGC